MAKNKQVSRGSQPSQTGAVPPANIVPVISFQDSMNAAATQIDALLRGGAACVTYIGSALLVGYLSGGTAKVKLSVMRDEFALALGKKGLGGTQTKKYLDYGSKIAANMFKECSYGMEMSALIAADTPDKAHDAVTAWLIRHTKGKKTETGFKLDDASAKLNVLGIYLGFEADPSKPDSLDGGKTDAEKTAQRRTTAAAAIEKDPGILSKVPAEKLVDTISKVITFDVLVRKHVDTMTEAKAIKAELASITKAYEARLKALTVNMGKITRKDIAAANKAKAKAGTVVEGANEVAAAA